MNCLSNIGHRGTLLLATPLLFLATLLVTPRIEGQVIPGYDLPITFNGTNFVVDGVPVTDFRQIVEAEVNLDNSTLRVKIGELPLKLFVKQDIARTIHPFNCRCSISGTGITQDVTETLLWYGCSHAWSFQVGDIVDNIGLNLDFEYRKGVYSNIEVCVKNAAPPCFNPLHAILPGTVIPCSDCWPWTCLTHIPDISIARYNAHMTSHIRTQVVDDVGRNVLKVVVQDFVPSDPSVGGVFPVLMKITLFGLAAPIVPGAGAGWTELLTAGLSNAFVDKIAFDIAERIAQGWRQEQDTLNFRQINETLASILGGLVDLKNQHVITLTGTKFSSTKRSGSQITEYGGLWMNFAINPALLQAVTQKLEPLVRYNNAMNMRAFDTRRINANHNCLIVSLSGAGVYPSLVASGKTALTTYTVRPSTQLSTYGDGIYPIPANYVSNNVVGIVGCPWLSPVLKGSFTTSDMQNFINDRQWGPDPREFAETTKAALARMAPGSKLILIGKSLGGCKLPQIAQELRNLNVNVDLLIIVDGSCYYPSDNQGSEFKSIYPNVRKVYNFRQISIPPCNDRQNGFRVSFSPPTIGSELIVGDEGNNIGQLMCEGVGHNDIDECTPLLNRIDELIRNELLVTNGNFEQGLSAWSGGGCVTPSVVAAGCNSASAAKVLITGQNCSAQFYQHGFSIERGKRYRVSFNAWSSRGEDMQLTVLPHNASTFNIGLDKRVDLGTNPCTSYSFEFLASGSTTDARLRFMFNYMSTTGYWYCFDNVSIEKIIAKEHLATSEMPANYKLEQNYPNPFNPTTTIKFQIPVDEYVSLKVFDMLGREVRTLVDGALEGGFKSVEFDATSLASGVYVYRLQAGQYVATKKLIIMR